MVSTKTMSTSRLVRDRAEDPRGDLAQRAEQEVHRPIRRVVGKPATAGDRDPLGHPPCGGQLAARLQRPLRHQREQHPLHRVGAAEVVDHLRRGHPGDRVAFAVRQLQIRQRERCHLPRGEESWAAGCGQSDLFRACTSLSFFTRPSLSSLDIERPRAAGRRLRRSTDCADDIDQRPLALRGFLQAFIVSRRHTA